MGIDPEEGDWYGDRGLLDLLDVMKPDARDPLACTMLGHREQVDNPLEPRLPCELAHFSRRTGMPHLSRPHRPR